MYYYITAYALAYGLGIISLIVGFILGITADDVRYSRPSIYRKLTRIAWTSLVIGLVSLVTGGITHLLDI